MAQSDWLQILVDQGLISPDQLKEAQAMAAKAQISMEKALDKLGYVPEVDSAKMKAEHFGFEFVDLDSIEIPKAVLEKVPESVARENTAIPVGLRNDRLVVAVQDPLDFSLADKLQFLINAEVEMVMAPTDAINSAIGKFYGGAGEDETESVDSIIQEFTETQIDFTATDLAEAEAEAEAEEKSPIGKLVNLIISEAITMRASDIHVEPFEDRIRIRYRIDGVLVERDSPPRRLLAAMTSRLKVMGGIDIAEKRRCQDGRIKTRVSGQDYDLRVSVLPTNHGQAVVLRILDRNNIKIGIRNLGLSEGNYRNFQNIIRRPNGIFLVTGPTGSGKTTTLYSALGEMNRPDTKIITAEDPVEYFLPGINQCQVNHKIGLNFLKIIKAMLRQAPNIILVGEIRDSETADMAIQASLTGHLVFSTLHTNDAPSSITRLIDMGVQPFLVASSVMAVLAQRLVRRVCPKCATEYTPSADELETFHITDDDMADAKFMRGKGCSNCQHTGYRGRVGVHELMVMNATIRDMTFRSEPAQNIRRQAKLFGMESLEEDAVKKAMTGVTTLSEAFKLRSGGH